MAVENLQREEKLEMSSDKTFGLVFFVLFVLVGLLPILHGKPVRNWSLVTGAVFLALALLAPKYLRPLNRLWMRFGLLLHHIVSPIALGVVFYVTVVPIGLWMRLVGKDPLKLSFEESAATYWVSRTPPGPDAKSMNNQF